MAKSMLSGGERLAPATGREKHLSRVLPHQAEQAGQVPIGFRGRWGIGVAVPQLRDDRK